jgi:hypothetical protein
MVIVVSDYAVGAVLALSVGLSVWGIIKLVNGFKARHRINEAKRLNQIAANLREEHEVYDITNHVRTVPTRSNESTYPINKHRGKAR